MANGGHDQAQSKPKPSDTDVTAGDQWSTGQGQNIGNDVFYRMCMHCTDAYRSRPLMVDLMDVFVQSGVVE